MRALGYIAAIVFAACVVPAIIFGLLGYSAYESGRMSARAFPYVLMGGLALLGIWVLANVVIKAIGTIRKD